MKIQVGKTYKDSKGCSWYVEAKLVNPIRKHSPYIVTTEGGGWNFVDEEGKVFGRGSKYGFDLLPNRVKKEGWGYKFSDSNNIYLVSTEEAADKVVAFPDGDKRTKVKVIWYEDEE